MTIDAVFPLLLQAFPKWAWHIWKTPGLITSMIKEGWCSCNTSSINQWQQGNVCFLSLPPLPSIINLQVLKWNSIYQGGFQIKLSSPNLNVNSTFTNTVSNKTRGNNWQDVSKLYYTVMNFRQKPRGHNCALGVAPPDAKLLQWVSLHTNKGCQTLQRAMRAKFIPAG